MKLENMINKYQENFNAVSKLVDDLYDMNFSQYFKYQSDRYKQISSKDTSKITDEDLEIILTDIPIYLFEVSERLSKFKLTNEVIKLQTKYEVFDNDEAMYESKLAISIYTAVIERVEKEITFSKELIMSCKKIWDSRKDTIQSNPVGEVDLPSYSELSDKTYIG